MSNPLPNGSPRLPLMSPAERNLWMLSHRAPEGMLMVHENELASMAGAVRGANKVVSGIFKIILPLKHEGEEPMDTMMRLVRDLGQLTIERDAYRYQCDDTGKELAKFEIAQKLRKIKP